MTKKYPEDDMKSQTSNTVQPAPQLSLFDIDKARYNYVAKHNDLIDKAKSDLSVQEMKLVDFIISRIKPTDHKFETVDVSLSDLAKVLKLQKNGKNNINIANSLRNLRRKEIIIKTETGSMVITGWLAAIEIEQGGRVIMDIDRHLTPYLLELKDKGNYTQYLLNDIVQLGSKYSIALYKFIKMQHGKWGVHHNKDRYQTLSGTLDEWRDMFDAPESYNTSIFMRNCVKKAIKEINLKLQGEMFIDDPEFKKNGHTITEMSLKVRLGDDPEDTSDKPRIPIYKISQQEDI